MSSISGTSDVAVAAWKAAGLVLVPDAVDEVVVHPSSEFT